MSRRAALLLVLLLVACDGADRAPASGRSLRGAESKAPVKLKASLEQDHSTADLDDGDTLHLPGASDPQSRMDPRKRSADALARAGKQAAPRALPRSFYFENTYLGGDAAVAERLRRLDAAWAGSEQPYRAACLDPQPFDPPTSHGMALSATLDRRSLARPGRVLLQIGLKGSDRVGWRRPPLDLMAVVDPEALDRSAARVGALVLALIRELGPQDRLGLLVAGTPSRVLAAPQRLRPLRGRLVGLLAGLTASEYESPPAELTDGLTTAGQLLGRIAGRGGIPGSQTVLLIAATPEPARVEAARQAAHRLALASVVTSIVQLGRPGAGHGWWAAAAAGQGQYHRPAPGVKARDVIRAELDGLSQVVARLLRINIRLAPHARCLRVLGSRKLAQAEVQRVKAREEATDRQLSRTLGVTSDRGKDDDGIQTVIPYFKGGDAHVILLELQVDKPGPVAEVSLRYKDLVRLTNAQVHTSVSLQAAPRERTPVERSVTDNAADFETAHALRLAARLLRRGGAHQARAFIDELRARGRGDDRVLRGFAQALRSGAGQSVVADALELAADRMVGQPADG